MEKQTSIGVNIASAETKSDQIQWNKIKFVFVTRVCSKEQGKTYWEMTTIHKHKINYVHAQIKELKWPKLQPSWCFLQWIISFETICILRRIG